jgi:hypothetical protein
VETETIYRNPITAELERRKAYLETLPGARLKEDLEALSRCSYTFGQNAQELANHVKKFLGSATLHARELSDDYVNELVRLLHNYLASVTSLIDAQRVVMRHRWPATTKDERSEFETTDYTKKLAATFATGEAEFMQKLRNYCTHYSIPVPGLGTSMSWEQGGPTIRVNTLRLDRDGLLRWDNWGAVAKPYLQQQPQQFDFAPIIERYMASAKVFFQWFWGEVNERSTELKDELHAKGTEVQLWWEEHNLNPDWLFKGDGLPPPDWNGRRERARRRIKRYRHGTNGFRISAVDPEGVVELGPTDWDSLPR